MEPKNPASAWLKYLFTRDRGSLFRIFVIIPVLAVIWWLTGQPQTFGIIVLAVLLAWVIRSFLVFLFIGNVRMAREKAFYDSIYYECGLPSPYDGRRMKSFEFKWRRLSLKPIRIDIKAGPTSPLAQDGNAWRKIKTASIEAFNFVPEHTLAHIDDLSKGFLSIGSVQHPGIQGVEIFQESKFIEELHAMVYENLAVINYTLPTVELSGFGNEGEGHMFQSLKVKTENQLSDYDVEQFRNKVAARYTGDFSWAVSYGPNHVELSKIARGSVEERQLQTRNSLDSLIAGTVRNAYMMATSEHIKIVPQSIQWDTTGLGLTGMRIDFGPTDLTDQEQVKSFEDYLKSGLNTLFRHAGWSFKWTISGYERFLDVSRVSMEAQPREVQEAEETVEPAVSWEPEAEIEPLEEVKGDDEEIPVQVGKPALPEVRKPAGMPQMPVRPKGLPPRPKFD